MKFDQDTMLMDLFIIYIRIAGGTYLIRFLNYKSARPKKSFENLDYSIFILKPHTCCSITLWLFDNYSVKLHRVMLSNGYSLFYHMSHTVLVNTQYFYRLVI